MIITGKFDRVMKMKNETIVSFSIPNYMARYLDELTNEEYKLEITKVRSKRSLQQNKFAWEVIGKIASVQGMDPDDVYCQIIAMARINTAFIETTPEMALEIRKVYKQMIPREYRKSSKGIETCLYEVYPGTSKFNIEQMSVFIDRLLDYAAESGIDTKEYEGWR